MPIRQDRMIALIRAAQDYQQALDNALEMMHCAANETEIINIQYLGGIRDHKLLKWPTTSSRIIAEEAKHFQLRERSNKRNAEYQARRRASAPVIDSFDDGPRKFDPWRQLSDEEQIKRDILAGKYTRDPAIAEWAEEAARRMNSMPEPTHTYNPDAPPSDSSPADPAPRPAYKFPEPIVEPEIKALACQLIAKLMDLPADSDIPPELWTQCLQEARELHAAQAQAPDSPQSPANPPKEPDSGDTKS